MRLPYLTIETVHADAHYFVGDVVLGSLSTSDVKAGYIRITRHPSKQYTSIYHPSICSFSIVAISMWRVKAFHPRQVHPGHIETNGTRDVWQEDIVFGIWATLKNSLYKRLYFKVARSWRPTRCAGSRRRGGSNGFGYTWHLCVATEMRWHEQKMMSNVKNKPT